MCVPDVSTTLPERLPTEARQAALQLSASVCAPPAGTSIVAGASRPGALTVQAPPPPPASLRSTDCDSEARAHEPERDARGRCEEARRICGLHVDHAAALREHARRVLVRGVVEDGPRRSGRART